VPLEARAEGMRKLSSSSGSGEAATATGGATKCSFAQVNRAVAAEMGIKNGEEPAR
jgi:hypothetical protein